MLTKILKSIRTRVNESIYIKEIPDFGVFYKENNEIGSKNLCEKLARVNKGGPFEWPNMIALNKAIEVFINDAKKVAVIGSGTATFEWHAAKKDKNNNVFFVSSDFDIECVEWCKKNRREKNIEYTNLTISELIKKHGKFDLVILVDVIEHIKDYGAFLSELSELADKAVITTPNKDRSKRDSLAESPSYYQHVREWDAGEFYWVLNMFYKNVELFAMPNVYIEHLERIGLMSTMTPLIAYCNK